jgi:hypothetical protein
MAKQKRGQTTLFHGRQVFFGILGRCVVARGFTRRRLPREHGVSARANTGKTVSEIMTNV